MSSMRNHRKRSHRSEKIHQSGRMGMRRYAPRAALPVTHDLTANMAHLRAWLRRLRGRSKKGGGQRDACPADEP